MPDCDAPGEYRAPKSRDALQEYWWFCLDHVRAYNATWDFYRGMSPGEIEAQVRADTSWRRPTWPLGQIGGNIDEAVVRRVAGAFGVDLGAKPSRPERAEAPPELREPLQTLGLRWPVSLDDVKARYKDLAKQNHPDANGGDRAAEERLKIINLAYAALRGRLMRQPEVAAG